MKKSKLGKTSIEVSKLCYGTLTFSPLQLNLAKQQVAKLIAFAYDSGVNFFDTADLYDNYSTIKAGLDIIGKYNVVIASKSYAYNQITAEASVYKALKALHRDYIDIWLMHEQESDHTMRGHYEALKTYCRLKERGVIRAIGLSTHFVGGAIAALAYPEIEIVHPIYNIGGYGIQGGGKQEMLNVINSLHQNGVGVYGMKALGGGHLINDRIAAFKHILSLKAFDSLAIGMKSEAEITYNCQFVNGEVIDRQLAQETLTTPRRLMIHDWCTRCQKCVVACGHKALYYSDLDDRIIIDHTRCVRCGYCSKHCPDFCIKVV